MMKILLLLGREGTISYTKYFFKVPFAFIGANLIILQVEKHSYASVVANPYYSIALLAIMGIALLVFNFVFWIAGSLYNSYPWGKTYRLNMPRQLFYDVLFPLFPGFLLAFGYLVFFETIIFDTFYFDRYPQKMVGMLTSVHVYFTIGQRLAKTKPNLSIF